VSATSFRILGALAILAFVVAPWVSTQYDAWWDGTQQEIFEHSVAMEAEREKEVRAANQERNQRVIGENCSSTLESQLCSKPTSFQDVENCVLSLRTRSCDALPGIHLCAAVEGIPACRRHINDTVTNRCDRLRDAADCQSNPAPDKPTHNWSISVPG